MTRAVQLSKIPIFFFQPVNDNDLSPSKTPSAAIKDAGKPYRLKIYPAYGKSTKTAVLLAVSALPSGETPAGAGRS